MSKRPPGEQIATESPACEAFVPEGIAPGEISSDGLASEGFASERFAFEGPVLPLACRPVQRAVVLMASLGMVIVTAATPVSLPRTGAATNPVSAHGVVSPAPAEGDRGEAAVFQVDLNSADVRELSLLPGIGPVLARRIVRHRERHGPFRRLDDLADVSGIGPKRLDELAKWCLPPRSPTSG